MHTFLWVLQGLLALVMLMPGTMKLSNSNEELIKKGNGRMDWAADISGSGMKWIGVAEILAGLGLILPMALDVLPWLTPLAAIGVVCIMIGAIVLHVRRKDGAKTLVVNGAILLAAAMVAYGRFTLL